MPSDVKLEEFVVNEMTQQQLDDLSSVPKNQMFLTTEEDGDFLPRGLPLGTIIPIAIETDDPYVQRLDGRSLLQTGIYSQFCEWLKNKVLENSSKVPTCTIEEYANEMATYTQCGKFVINNTTSDLRSGNYSVPANSIKLPTIVEFVGSSNGGEIIGLAELDEFKSHTHTQNPHSHSIPVLFGWGEGTWNSGPRTDSNNPNTPWFTDLNNTTAINNSTGGEETRPKNIRYPYYIVVANNISDVGLLNSETVVRDINELREKFNREKFTLNKDCYVEGSGQSISGNGALITINSSLFNFEIYNDGKYFILYNIVYQNPSGTTTLRLYLDDVEISRITFSDTIMSPKTIGGFSNISKGIHEVKLIVSQNQNVSGLVAGYTTNKCYIMEV